MTANLDSDVLVIGGGPAGAVTAGILATHGVKVVLIEKQHFPRHHVGESLQPACIDLLNTHFDVEQQLRDLAFARKYGAVYVWGESRDPWSVLFDEALESDLDSLDEASLLSGPYEYAWQVDRSKFDSLLLNVAAKRGVDVRQGCEAIASVRSNGRVTGLKVRTTQGEEHHLSAQFVVDASGQRCLLARERGLVCNVSDLKATATYAYFQGAGGLEGALGRHAQLVTTIPNGWAWFIPISADLTSVGLVSQARERIDSRTFMDGIHQAALPLDGAKVVHHGGREIHFARDWSFYSKELVGPGWLLVGDSAGFVDPILSGGVDFAVRSACNAALALLDALQRPPETRATPLASYADRIRREYDAYLQLARYWYSNNRSVEGFFWEAHRLIEPNSLRTPLRAFVYLTSGRYAADQHFKVFAEWQEQKMFRSLGVDRQGLQHAMKPKG